MVEAALRRINLPQLHSHTDDVPRGGVSELMASCVCRFLRLAALEFLDGFVEVEPTIPSDSKDMAQSLPKKYEKARDLDKYMLGFQRCLPPWECFAKEGKMHVDFHGEEMNLYDGIYTMGPFTSNCIIKKFKEREQIEQYKLLKDFRHSNVVSVENLYEEGGYPRFVLSWVDGSLTGWLKAEGATKMFKSTMKGRAPTGAMRHMILDFCRGLERLLDEKLYPVKIEKEDLYVCQLGHKGVAKLLVKKVEKLNDKYVIQARKTKLWEEMRTTLYDICKEAAGTFDPIAERFLNSIGVMSVTKLQSYPDCWDYRKKARFLLSAMSQGSSVILPMVQGVGIEWPKTQKGRVCSPFYEMLKHEAKTQGGRTYNLKEPFDFLRLCKNMIKHWRVIPATVKAECATVEHLIDKMERCNRLIWCILYDATA